MFSKYCFQKDELDILLPLGKEIPCLEVTSFVYNLKGKFVVHVNVGSSVKYQAYDFHQVDLNSSLLEIQFEPPKSPLSKRDRLHDSDVTVFCVMMVNNAGEIWSLGILQHHYWFSLVENISKIVNPVLPGKLKGVLKRLASYINEAYCFRLQHLNTGAHDDLDSLDKLKLKILADLCLLKEAGENNFDEDMLLVEDLNETIFPDFDTSFKNIYSEK